MTRTVTYRLQTKYFLRLRVDDHQDRPPPTRRLDSRNPSVNGQEGKTTKRVASDQRAVKVNRPNRSMNVMKHQTNTACLGLRKAISGLIQMALQVTLLTKEVHTLLEQ